MKRNFSFKVIKNLIKHTLLIDEDKELINGVMDAIKSYNKIHVVQKSYHRKITNIDGVHILICWNDESKELDFKLNHNPDGMLNYILEFSLNLDNSYQGEFNLIPIDYKENNITKINFYDWWTLYDGFSTDEDLLEYGDVASNEEREIIERAMRKNDM